MYPTEHWWFACLSIGLVYHAGEGINALSQIEGSGSLVWG